MKILPFLLFLFLLQPAYAETGYRLWLRYDKIENQHLLNEYRQQLKNLFVDGDSPTLLATQKELLAGLGGLLGEPIPRSSNLKRKGLLIFTPFNSNPFKSLKLDVSKLNLGSEGFMIKTISLSNTKAIVVATPEEIGVLYGAFHFLRLIQTNASINNLAIEQSPTINLRLLNHWDNLDRTVERGYAGFSIWNWHKLPKYIDPRYEDYDEDRFHEVKMLLDIQHDEAVWWRNACLLYFQQFSKQPIPTGLEKPSKTLDYYTSLEFRYAPGIRLTW